MPFQLRVEAPGGPTRHLLQPGPNDVGSVRGADVRLRHPSVSRRHARLVVDDSGVVVEDLGSRNGTRLADRRITGPERVAPGQAIAVGEVAAVLEEVSSADLEPAVRLDGAGPHAAAATAAPAPPPTTIAAGSLPRFVLDHLPVVLDHLERRAPLTPRAQAVGGALFATLPCATVGVLREAGDGVRATLFQAEREGADAAVTVTARAGEVVVEVGFAHELAASSFRSLVESAARLVALGGPARTAATAPRTSPPPLPSPPSVEPEVQAIYRDAARVARGDVSVLVTGESGTGKEVLAWYVHAASSRAAGPFLALNCAALPRDLLEAELFGVESGVATGVDSRPGKFELAAGGTLFLDEIGDMAPDTQAKILRVLQEGEVYRLGGQEARPARARVVAATNQDLDALRETGGFRDDLYHRIADWRVRLPALRERRRDVANLAAHFLAEEAARHGVAPAGLSRAALDVLEAHPWPGNIRQLQREIARAVLFLEDGELLQTRHLQVERVDGGQGAPRTLAERLERVERREIEGALRRSEGNVSAAARELGIARSTLYRRAGELGIET